MADKQHIRKLFIKLAAGTCTPAEKAQLKEYLDTATSDEALPLISDLENQDSWPEMPAAQADAVLENILAADAPADNVVYKRFPVWRIAAAVTILMVLAAVTYWIVQPGAAGTLYKNEGMAVRTITLPDGTVVQLNKGAVLQVAAGFNKKTRTVQLNGEAFFSVAPAAGKVFTVTAGNDLQIKVLGTEFNVCTTPGHTQVVLNKGSVKVEMAAAPPMLLQPGEMASLDKKSRLLRKEKADTLFFTAWKNNFRAFKNEKLSAVASYIKTHYGYTLVFEQITPADLYFTGYLSSTDPDKAMETLEQSFNLKRTMKADSIFLHKQ
ncbi:FecR family protein [Chitinophaga nivalis]|uniref:FecR domain-containing protein n=1 Tax=Chitinophaga nivalis TaxID=2991709 RepID=A0ABT3IF52_9BACT|nr:FecR domain-containing protein [Chitinophaga nivalis]MCW3467726.1 FecR domain-containing protein [Chitinophaga nivalis]MCW3482582.1 FecR domain-containing protein [Chitinophaga nivalis]